MTGNYGVQIGKENIAGAVNTIGSNGSHGIHVAGGSQNFKIFNNLIGTNSVNTNIGNGGNGILVTGNAHNGTIGSANIGSGNTITNNTNSGISIPLQNGFSAPDAVTIIRNSIYSNGSLGIDLNANGVTLNDGGDPDTGANDLQNFPVIEGASTAQINGTLNSTPNNAFRLDFYRVDSCELNGYGEDHYYVGSTEVTTDASGNAVFLALNVALSTGQIITATATQKTNAGFFESTSEFSQCQTVSQLPGNLSLNAATYSVNENAGTATITVNRSNGTVGTIGVSYSTSNGTATAGQDNTATSGTLTFASGETSKTFSIAITDDQSDEAAETVNIALSNPTGGAAIVSPSTAVLTINDNDAPPTVSASDVAMLEGNEGTKNFTFNITLSAASGFPVSVNYQTANGTANAGVDYQAANSTVNFAAGEVSKAVTVLVNGDTLAEINETFFLNLSNPTNATVGNAGAATIQDDDNPGKLQFSTAAYTVSENGSLATITVTRTNGAAGAISVDFMTQNGTATAGQDFTSVSGTLVLNDGQQSANFVIPIINDQTGEPSETVILILSNPLGGTTLGSIANAILTITDDDGGLPANVSIGGQITKNNLPLPNVFVTLAGSQTATATTDANGNYTFSNLPAGGNYLVTPTLAGHNFEPGSRSYSALANSQSSANFTATSGMPARKLRVVSADTVPNNSVVVPVELIAQGSENSAGFSLSYDSGLLYNPQVALGAEAATASLVFNNSENGKIGVIVALPAGQTFFAGTRRVVNITFQTAQTNLYSTALSFVNQPIAGEVSDANANTLPATFENRIVTFAHGFESDVAPRPTGTGNGTVTVADFTQIGKFVAGTAAPDQLNEFQRADSASRGTKGNGVLTVSDYTQAGRYAAGLDTVQSAGGAHEALSLLRLPEIFENQNQLAEQLSGNNDFPPRAIRVVNAQTAPGQQVLVSIEMDAQGDENAAGFTLNYDSSKLSNPLVTLGAGATGATLIPNTTQTGKVGVVIGLPAGQKLQAGTQQIVTVRFDVSANAAGGQSALTFSNAPVFREVVDANADVLATSFTNGMVNILGPTSATVTIGGRIATRTGRAVSKATIMLIDSSGSARFATSNASDHYSFTEVTACETYILSVSSKRYVFNPSSQIVTINEDRDDINFTAEMKLL